MDQNRLQIGLPADPGPVFIIASIYKLDSSFTVVDYVQ
jgi:hypothetical protein